MAKRFRDRSTGDIMVLMIAGTVCSSIFVGGAAIIALAIFVPDKDTTAFARNIADLLNTLIGLLAGFLAGRTDAQVAEMRKQREQERPPEEGP